MPKTGHLLSEFLQQSYIDNSGRKHRIGRSFTAEIELVDQDARSGKRFCEPVQVVDRKIDRLEIDVLGDFEECSLGSLSLENEDDDNIECSFKYDARSGKIEIFLPDGLDIGYYYLNAQLSIDAGEILVRQLIICSPGQAWRGRLLETRNVLAVQLYALRSSSNWGIGDFGDLRNLAKKAQKAGYCYIALNPMHMTHIAQVGECSPYSPVSRLMFNWLYIDIEGLDIFKVEKARLAKGFPFEGSLEEAVGKLTSTAFVDYEHVAKIKFWVLNELARCFWLRYENAKLSHSQFAEFLRFDQQRILGQVEGHCGGQDIDKQVRQFHLFTQYCCQQQLQDCFPVSDGIQPIYDLAIGVKADSLEVLADPDCYVSSMSIGAPPDAFNQSGQCWNIAPFNPVVLRDRFYRPLIELLQANMPKNGGIRIDHVMWLARQFWIKVGGSALRGGYIRFPVDEVLAILRLESVQRNCIVIGEDLGTVPRGFRSLLTRSGIYLMDVLPFSNPDIGTQGEMEDYPEMVAAFTGTHDMPMFAAIWDETHIRILSNFGLISNSEVAETEAQTRTEKMLFEKIIGKRNSTENCQCSYVLLSQKLRGRKPSFYFSLLDDVVSEVLPINIPGTIDQYPNWQRKHSVLIEDLELSPV